ncbi:MAG: HD domain-containing protein [Planctomycetaceae bacterium]|nr:HD domain-containing protein [Planctomycetaceae bacterium]
MQILTERSPASGRSPAAAATSTLPEVIAALSCAFDISEGQPAGHAARTCLIGMRIAHEIGLSPQECRGLFYGSLLKDAGSSSNAAQVCALFGADDHCVKFSARFEDLSKKYNAVRYLMKTVAGDRSPLSRAARLLALAGNPGAGRELIQTRCSRGAEMALRLGLGERAAAVIRAVDEHWDGSGEPLGLSGQQIPLGARIACLAQTIEAYFSRYGHFAAICVAEDRAGKWFDPDLVRAFVAVGSDLSFWRSVETADQSLTLRDFAPAEECMPADEDLLDQLAVECAAVIDAKSPWTAGHSVGVADTMEAILTNLGYSPQQVRHWRRAALLHDIGQLGVSNLILDKAGPLTNAEFASLQFHVEYTRRILRQIPCFRDIADVAAAHHEKLDGSGYVLGLTRSELSTEARALAVADIFDALAGSRPYRQRPLGLDEVLDIMSKDAGSRICPVAWEALRQHVETLEFGCYRETAAS